MAIPKPHPEPDRARALQRARLKREEDWVRLKKLRLREQELLDQLREVRTQIASVFGGERK